MLTRILSAFLLMLVTKLAADPPTLKIYISGKQIFLNNNQIKIEAKMGGKFYSILNNKKEIILHDDLILQEVSMFRFIIKRDTLLFPVGKIFEDLVKIKGKNKIDEMYKIFNEIAYWEIYIDKVSNFFTNTLAAENQNYYPQLETYKDYKIYALRTSTLKYYLPHNKK